jgi:hypothetical protein
LNFSKNISIIAPNPPPNQQAFSSSKQKEHRILGYPAVCTREVLFTIETAAAQSDIMMSGEKLLALAICMPRRMALASASSASPHLEIGRLAAKITEPS